MRASLFDFGDIDAITYIVQVSRLAERMHTRIDLGHLQPWGEDSIAVIKRALVRGPIGIRRKHPTTCDADDVYQLAFPTKTTQLHRRRMMGNEKSKRARRAAESLFGELPTSSNTTASRSSNPFGNDPFDNPASVTPTGNELVVLPAQFELPPGYEDAAAMRDALARIWRMDWIKVGKDECVVRLPVGWRADKSVDGVLRIESAGVVRAQGRIVEGAALQILPRYYLKAEFHEANDHCRIVVRDRGRNNSVLKDSFWDTRSGPNHPQWKILSDWLDKEYPDHRDPLRYWEDCEDNRRGV